MSQSMNNCERAEMLRLMAEELNDSISTYEGAKKRPNDATQAYGGVPVEQRNGRTKSCRNMRARCLRTAEFWRL